MKFFVLFLSLVSFGSSSLFSQKEIKTFLLNKEEYKYLETNNILVSKAIENVFGHPNKQNYYKLEITRVGAWNSKVTEFQYYPANPEEQKKAQLKSIVLGSKENMSIKLRVNLDG